jgi:hypothetical protein
MQEYTDTNERERLLMESIQELEAVNKQIAELIVRKEELTQMIIGALGHEHEGQRSYEYNTWKIEVKTPFTYTLNKKKYESQCESLPSHFNPIKESVAYSIDKRLCEQYMQEAPSSIRDILIDLIDKKPGKPGVTIKGRV